ncbi:MAG: rubrerythrin family protein [Veillonellaceae bacterium]|nr:rubrerythrin family protein [Veillonellaceae bacterium]
MNNTQKNLAAAFAGESQANRKYLAFAKQADAEKLPQVAKLFRAAAEAETIHAHTHLRNLGMIKSTTENLREAIAGETYEFTEMYPSFISEAQNENQSAAIVKGMQLANDAEKVHASLYQKALDTLGNPVSVDYYLCSVCGHIAEGTAPDQCPICGAKAAAYKKVD